jgi:hypothetical protein
LPLSLDGARARLRSSHRLEQATHRHVAWMELLTKRRPDHKTMAKFRRDNLHAMRQVCHACTRLCQQCALGAGAPGARDGSPCKAVQAQEHPLTPHPCAVVAERGDAHGAEVQTGVEAGLTPSGARPLTAATKKLGLCSKDDFHYDGATAPPSVRRGSGSHADSIQPTFKGLC